MQPARRWLAFLSAALAALALVLAVLLPASTASAASAPAAGTRVGASHPVMIFTVGSSRTVSAGERRCEGLPQPRIVAGACVAAEDGASDVLATPQVENPKLQNVVNDLYKGTTNPNRVGTGTTADAVRNEIETGQPTGGTFHSEKAAQYSNALSNLLKTGNLNPYDQLVARSLLEDLQSALGNRP